MFLLSPYKCSRYTVFTWVKNLNEYIKYSTNCRIVELSFWSLTPIQPMPRPCLHPAQECPQCQGCWICKVGRSKDQNYLFGVTNWSIELGQFQGLPIDDKLHWTNLLHCAQGQVHFLPGSVVHEILLRPAHQVWKNVFQDDLFPPTRVLWQASCSGARWLAGELGAALWVGRLYSPLDFQSLQFLLD